MVIPIIDLLLVLLGGVLTGIIIGHKLSNVTFYRDQAEEYLCRVSFLLLLLESNQFNNREILERYRETNFPP